MYLYTYIYVCIYVYIYIHTHICNICTSHCMVFLLALDLAVISNTLLTDDGLEETQTKTREEESTLCYKEKKGMLKDDIDLVITCVLSELKDQLDDPFDDDHYISLSSTSKCRLYSCKVYVLLMSFS